MTYAIANIKNKQFKLIENQYIYVPHVSSNVGEIILLDQVFLFHKEGELFLGNPFLEEINVKIEVLQHVKGKKIIIFKKKRRKGYQVKNGFRPLFSKIKIISFLEKKQEKK
ncbi:50S ribosomal protein L21 [Blattabacterium sp. (Blaberus giganteus)]|uniref:50S ribosomal protein L21 n=1 Tax=Blattabacterium sp. (Blaberus giganteus) TaxID=1186051 RepID=UPI00025F7085|nr:50S ribosomal protein L21 [Blattabacterium sp. (Blaberus giganteus)]AFJ91021.1 50S ribosomal protein L21 [Blattabacterium sp. (Blaberus giganteus)]